MFLYFLGLVALLMVYILYKVYTARTPGEDGYSEKLSYAGRNKATSHKKTKDKEQDKEQNEIIYKDDLYTVPEEKCSDTSIKEVVEKVLSFPKPSSLVHRIYALIQDPDCSPKDVAAIAQTDPILASKILQTINSIHYSLPNKVNSVFSAILLMGYSQLYKMIVSLELQKSLKSININPEWKSSLWLHSVTVSTISGYLAKKYRIVPEGLASTAGLLHDIGKIYMCPMIEKKEDFESMYENTPTGSDFLRNEAEYFGVTHTVVGACLIKHWGFSPMLKQVAAYHHFPLLVAPSSFDPENLKIITLVFFSDLIAKAYRCENMEMLTEIEIDKEYFEITRLPKNLPSVLDDPQLLTKLKEGEKMVKSMS